MWQQVPVISATQEAKAGESLDPRMQKLQFAKITLVNCNLCNRARLCLKKKKKERKKKIITNFREARRVLKHAL